MQKDLFLKDEKSSLVNEIMLVDKNFKDLILIINQVN